MNLKRILIEESEKNRILGMHSKHKSLITEAVTDFPACVRSAGKEITLSLPQAAANIMGSGYQGTTQLNSIYVIDPSTKYTYYWVAKPKVVVYVPTDPNNTTKKIQVKSYHCGCKNGKLSPISRPYDGKEIKDEVKCEGQGGQTGGQKDSNCKNKTPYNAITDAGLNWKEESRKWIEAKCNGTTPCISGNAATNINLRNAFCDGTFGSKPGQEGGGEQTEACKEKCSKQPRVVPPGSIITMQVGYFYDSTKGKCVGVSTGENGPFTSIEDCEKCKCNSQSSLVDGKLPDTKKLLECATKHLKITQLPISCTSTASNIMPTDPTQCFNDILKGIDQNTVKDFILCLFGDSQIPKIIRELPLPGINIPIGKLPGLEELPDFIAPVIEKPKSFD